MLDLQVSMSKENEIIQKEVADAPPLGRRTERHDFYSNIVLRVFNAVPLREGVSEFLLIIGETGYPNDRYVAADRFRFLVSTAEGDPYKPNSRKQIAQSLDMSVGAVRRAESRVVNIAADLCEDMDIPPIPPLPRPIRRARE